MQKNIFIKDFIYFIILFLLTTVIYFLYVENLNLDFLLNQNANQIEALQNQINMLKQEIAKKPEVLITETPLVENQSKHVSSDYSWILFAFIGLVLTYKVFGFINLYYTSGLFCGDVNPNPPFSETTGLLVKAEKIEGSPFYNYFIKAPGEDFLTFEDFLVRFEGVWLPDNCSDALRTAISIPQANLDKDTWSFLLNSSSWPGGSPLLHLRSHAGKCDPFFGVADVRTFDFTASGVAEAMAFMKNDPGLLHSAVSSVLS